MERIITYIDGFNLYFGLKSKKWKRFYWLDLRKLTLNLLKPSQELVKIKYFTAKIQGPSDKQDRQNTFLDALATLPDLDIFYGKYQLNPRNCRNCGFNDLVPGEKMTDVNIAVEMLVDAFSDNYDSAILVSADSDLIPAIRAVKSNFPTKRIISIFPPDRNSAEIKKYSDATLVLGRGTLSKSTFPNTIQAPNRYLLSCPPSWR
jgi:uncharacterized LabA/DUF88 family protein